MIAALRFNNPGDISLPMKGWFGGGKVANNGKGIRGQDGYAEFPTMQIGYEAAVFRVETYISEGLSTIRSMAHRYAQDQHWPYAIAELSGIGVGSVLDPDDKSELDKLVRAILTQEMGRNAAEQVFAKIDTSSNEREA